MNRRALPLAAVAVLLVCTAAVWKPAAGSRAVGSIAIAPWPYFPQSRIALRVDGFPGPYAFAIVGAGGSSGRDTYDVPSDATGGATLVATNAIGLAVADVRVARPPSRTAEQIAVASYDDGLVLHDGDSFAVSGVLGIDGAPGDVASLGRRVVAIDTQGDRLTVVSRDPWRISSIGDVPLGDQVALDPNGDAFVTNRELGERGGLTRISHTGAVTSVVTGQTAEGVAVDSHRGLVYVANANDGTISVVGARTMRVLRRFRAVDRVFSLALDRSGAILYAVSNQSADPPFAAAGSVVAFDVRSKPRRIAGSGNLTFPLGIAYDGERRRVFVTDESADLVYVLNATNLRPQRAPLATCKTPWKPYLDAPAHRIYVPCARSSQVDVFDDVTLRRVAGAPFATGGYPLAVAVSRASEKPRS